MTITTHTINHQFWLANIQDACIIGLDLLSELGAEVDVPMATLYLGMEAIALHTSSEGGPRIAASVVQELISTAVTGGDPTRLTGRDLSSTAVEPPEAKNNVSALMAPSMETRQAIEELFWDIEVAWDCSQTSSISCENY